MKSVYGVLFLLLLVALAGCGVKTPIILEEETADVVIEAVNTGEGVLVTCKFPPFFAVKPAWCGRDVLRGRVSMGLTTLSCATRRSVLPTWILT